jgi:hypothetical protein
MKNYAIFSVNGRFIGFTNFKPVNGLYKELPDNFDPVLQVYVGDYETGKLKNVSELETKDYREANIDQKWKVFESELNEEISKLIVEDEDITLYKQVNAIMEVLYLNKDKIQLTEQFKEIYETIEEIRFNHKKSLEVYKDAPKADFISKDDEKLFYEEYTLKQLNITEEPVKLTVIEDE